MPNPLLEKVLQGAKSEMDVVGNDEGIIQTASRGALKGLIGAALGVEQNNQEQQDASANLPNSLNPLLTLYANISQNIQSIATLMGAQVETITAMRDDARTAVRDAERKQEEAAVEDAQPVTTTPPTNQQAQTQREDLEKKEEGGIFDVLKGLGISSVDDLLKSFGVAVGKALVDLGITLVTRLFPAGLLVSIAATIGYGIYKYFTDDEFKQQVNDFCAGIKDFVMDNVFNPIVEKISSLVSGIGDVLSGIWNKITDFASASWNTVKIWLGVEGAGGTTEMPMDPETAAMAAAQEAPPSPPPAPPPAPPPPIKPSRESAAGAGRGTAVDPRLLAHGGAGRGIMEGAERTDLAPIETRVPTPVAAEAEATKVPASEAAPKKVSSSEGKQAMITAMDANKISDPTQRAAIMAQTGHESGNFTTLSENLRYSASGLMRIFKKYFGTEEEAQEASNKGPVAIANRVYGNRMGNGPEESGDGFKYRGRGFIQLTGKNNYKSFGLAESPDSLFDVSKAADVAVKFMMKYKGDWSDNTQLTKFVNGGTIGLEDRKKHFEAYLNDPEITRPATATEPSPSTGTQLALTSTRNQQTYDDKTKVNVTVIDNSRTNIERVSQNTTVVAYQKDKIPRVAT